MNGRKIVLVFYFLRLFSGAICQSGMATNQWAFTTQRWALDHAFELGKLLGCKVSYSPSEKQELYECLLNADPSMMTLVQPLALTFSEVRLIRPYAFVPVIEPESDGAVFTKSVLEYYTSGDYNHVPLITGVTNSEGIFVSPHIWACDPSGLIQEVIVSDLTRFLPIDLNITKRSPESACIQNILNNLYFNGTETTSEHTAQMLDIASDYFFTVDIQRTINLLAKTSCAPVWSYVFSYDGPFNLFKTRLRQHSNYSGATHTDELGYMMNPVGLSEVYQSYSKDSVPHEIIDNITRLWANFAKYGNPTPDCSDIQWKPFTSESHYYLDFKEKMELKEDYKGKYLKIWNDVFEIVQKTRPLPERCQLKTGTSLK